VRFGDTPVAEAEGAILAHSFRASGLNFAKGRKLSADDVSALARAGVASVIAARLDAEDLHEDAAATEVAAALAGVGIDVTAAFTGRCNHYARTAGLALIDQARIDRLNELDESVTVATLPPMSRVSARQMVATVKIIPYAAPRSAVARAIAAARGAEAAISVAPFRPLKAGLVQTRLAGTRDKVLDKAIVTTRERMTGLGGTLSGERRVAHEPQAIAGALAALRAEGCDLLLVAGASANVDRRDVVPLGIERAGGRVEHVGMPVDPGNLLVTARWGEVPVLGLPGCAKSPKYNGFDMVLERLAARLPVGRAEIVRMGAGGLLAEIASRPQPRDNADAEAGEGPAHAPRVAVVLLAAGRSTRMGGPNKLLAELDGVPLVAHAARAALAAQTTEVVVVLGHMADQVRAAVRAGTGDDARLRFVLNLDYAGGLSTSVRVGITALGAQTDGAIVQLGDMPGIDSRLLDRLIAAYNPLEGRAICLPTVAGKRGNPVLWGKRFFADLARLAGDTGARHLVGEHAELVCEVPMEGDAALVDIDDPPALAAWRQRLTT